MSATSSMAQQDRPSSGLLKCSLLRDSLLVEETSFSFNNFNFTNNSGDKIDIEILFITPDFIDIISGKEIKTSIEGSQSKIIPFRFGFGRKSIPVGWYPVTAEIRIKQTGEILKKTFYLRPKENNNWKASLKQPSMTFTSTDKEILFDILIQNTGNNADVYKISFETELKLDQPKKNLIVELQPGTKTAVHVKILLNPKETQFIPRQGIDITVRNKAGEQKLMQQFISLIGYMYTGVTERWNKMPLALELNLQNLASPQPFAYLNARGYINLNDNSRLSIQYQSNHYYKGYSVDAQLARVEYQKGRINIGVGSIVDFNNFLIDGMGGRFTYTTKKESVVELTGAKGRTGRTQYYNARVYSILNKNINFSSNAVANLDRNTNVNSYMLLNRMDWAINKSTRVTIEAGAGSEQIARSKLDTNLNGLQAGYLIEKSGKNFQLRSSINIYSKNFPGFSKGFQYQLHEAKWFGEQLFAGVYLEKNHRSYNSAQDSAVTFLFNLLTSEYGIRTGFRLPKGSIVFSPGVLTQRQDSLSAVEAKMYKIGLNANFQFSEKASLSLFSNAGRVMLDKNAVNAKSFNSITNLATFQAGLYGFNIRYDDGPYYYYEIKQFLNEPSRLKRFQVSPFLEVPLTRWNLSYRLQLNYMKEQPIGTTNYMVYNNLQYSSYKKGLDIGITGQWNIKGTEEPFVNLVIRKKLKIPLLLNKNSMNLNVRLYLDKNADGKFNNGDEVVNDAIVVAGEALLMTNKEGIISFKNVNRKAIRLDLSHISHLKGWIPKSGYNQVITPGSAINYYIPFSKSKVVSGSLLLVRDDKSYTTMDLDAIRLIAVSSTGETYNTFTNAAGDFFFNLPAGNFTITINEAAFDENFRPVETTKLADLINNDQLQLQFEVRREKAATQFAQDQLININKKSKP